MKKLAPQQNALYNSVMASYNIQTMKFFKKDRTPDTELAQKVYDCYCEEDEDFKDLWELDGNELKPTVSASDYGQNADLEFPVEVFEEFAPEKFEATVQEEATSSLDWAISKYNNGNGTSTLTEDFRQYYHLCSDDEDFFLCAQDKRIYKGWRGSVYPWYIEFEEQESRVKLDSQKYLIADDFQNRHLLDCDGNFIKKPVDYDHLEDTGTPIPQISTEVKIKISNYKKDPSLRAVLEEMDKKVSSIFDEHTTNLDEGLITGTYLNTKLFDHEFHVLMKEFNTFNATVTWDSCSLSYNHGECTFSHIED